MIAHAGKVGGLHQFTVLQIAISLVSTIAIVDQFSRELLFIAFPPNPPDPIEDEVNADMVLVVDRHMPVNRIAFADPSLVANSGYFVGHDEIIDADIASSISCIANCVVTHSELGALGLELWPRVGSHKTGRRAVASRNGARILSPQWTARQGTVQKGEVGGIDVTFKRLQIVALHEGLLQIAAIWRCGQEFVVRQQWRLAPAHIGEQKTGALDEGIGEVANFVLVLTFRWFGRLLQAASVDVVKPAMIEAAQPAILDPAVAEIGAAMRAVETEQARAAAIVAKQDQVLAKDFDRHRRRTGQKLVGERDWMP